MSYCMYHICLLHLDCSKYDVSSQNILFIITSSVNLYFNLIFLPYNIIAIMSQKHCYYTAIV